MKLPFSLSFEKKEKSEYFLALLLRDKKVNAAIFQETAGKIKVVGEHEEYFEDSIETASLEEWLDVCDKVISVAENNLPPNVLTKKTIFGVKSEWVLGTKIKKEHLLKLKKTCEALNLEPIGFLVIAEAIVHLIQKEEGAPLSAILVEINQNTITISVVKSGKIIETKITNKGSNVPKTTDELLKHISSVEILPSRIILINGDIPHHETEDHEYYKNENLIQEFIGHSWSKTLPFLHMPQITSLPKGFDAKAILSGAASQMGFEILKDVSGKRYVQTPNNDPEPLLETESGTEEELQDTEEEIETLNSSEAFGFLKDQDLLEVQKYTAKKSDSISTDESFIHHNLQVKHMPQKENKTKNYLMSGIKSVINTIPNIQIPRFNLFPEFSNNKKILFLLFLFLIMGGIILFYLLGLKATVTLLVDPKTVDQDKNITFSINSSSDFSKNTLSAQTISVSEEGSVSTPATGKKETGEKAKGSITLYNRLTQEKTLEKGTIITAVNNIQFVLDSAINLASASADASALPVTAKVNVTAKDIGKEYNLPSGTKFTVNSFDPTDIVGKNENAFSGGNKKEIIIVAKSDVEKLSQDLIKDLSQKAKNDLQKKLDSDKFILPLLLDQTLSKKNLDKNIGDETKIATLKGTVDFKGAFYTKKDIEEYGKISMQEAIKNMVLTDKGIMSNLKDVKQKSDSEINATIHMKALLVPKLDIQKTIPQITGKSFDEAQQILAHLPQVSHVDIEIHPNLSFLPKFLPRVSHNITLVVENNE